MSQDHAFRLTSCARGVDKCRQILRLDGTYKRIENRVALRTENVGVANQGTEGNGSVWRGRIHDDDVFKRRERADGVQLVILLASGDDRDAAIGVSNQCGDLLAGKRGINWYV